MRRAAFFVAILAGCGSTGGSAKDPNDVGPRGIEAAALPYKILRGHGGEEVSEDVFLNETAGARAVCVGESHKNPHHHWAQLHIFQALSDRARTDGAEMALGMEMFQRPVQGVLDDFDGGKIDEVALLGRSDWEHRWGYDFKLYKPMMVLARERKLPILALNAPEGITHKVAHEGLEALSPGERQSIAADLDLSNADHKAYFKEAMGDHGMPSDGFDRFYTAQVIWDETMAETAAKWLEAAATRRIVILAGIGHCHDAAIPSRVRRRGAQPALSVQPVIDDGEGNVADLLAAPENDYLFVMDRGK